MAAKEATARIKINRLLDEAGWRFFDDANGPANIVLEPNVKLKAGDVDALGSDFEKASNGFVDFLLLDGSGKPLIVLEAKSEDKHPLVGKEQARKYARSQNARFVILSNGNIHFLWDLEQGNPSVISKFPSPTEIGNHYAFEPNAQRLAAEKVGLDFIVLTQMPAYAQEAAWRNDEERTPFIEKNKFRFLRRYQQRAIERVQEEALKGATRFLFEMATGTGKTLTSAAIVKLFLKTRNAKRVLFLVDRLELEVQADKAFKALLKNDFTSVIYKEQKDDWRKADIVVTTVQSLLFNDKYRRLFAPTDFDLVISDEAHRSIGGNARAVFEYFIGYKLGLTATPKDYLKQSKDSGANRDPREAERRMMLDTYRTFGCESGEPTFRYSLVDGVNDGFLINPYVVDARTGVTTQLLSDEGFVVETTDEDGNEVKEAFAGRDFEKRFFAEHTNQILCKTLLQHGLRDPVSGEFGKTIAFAVSQNHAAKITQILNEMADQLWPGRYNSDFAMQVTSQVADAQIEGYQRVIDGARAVLDNYRPHIPVDPAWPVATLGNAAETIMTGPFGTSLKESDYTPEGVPVVNPKNIVAGQVDTNGIKRVEAETIERLKEFLVRSGDVIIGRRGEMGRCAVIKPEMDGWLCGTGCFVIRPASQCSSEFIALQISSSAGKRYLDDNAVGVTMKNLNQSVLSGMPFVMPDLQTQQTIVAEIEAEQALVDGNRDLIARFEKKIDAAIARVWGEAKGEGAA